MPPNHIFDTIKAKWKIYTDGQASCQDSSEIHLDHGINCHARSLQSQVNLNPSPVNGYNPLLSWLRLLPVYGLSIISIVILFVLVFQSGIVNARGLISSDNTKRIVVDVAEQNLYAYQGNDLVYHFIVSTGENQSTRIGTYTILDKKADTYSDRWGYRMPDWLGIYWFDGMENGLHGLPVLPDGDVLWGAELGKPVSHGDIILNTKDAQSLYEWVEIGTRVEIVG